MTAILCGYRECGGLEVLSRWSNRRFVGRSVLGGLEEVEGGSVVVRRGRRVDEGEVRRLDLPRTRITQLLFDALGQCARESLRGLRGDCGDVSSSVRWLRNKRCSKCNCSGREDHVATDERSICLEVDAVLGFTIEGKISLAAVNECCSGEQSRSGVSPDTWGE